MSLPLILRPSADADIQASYEQQVHAGLGDRFVGHVREALERIEATPKMYGLVWQDVRLRKFQHVVYYIAFDDRVEILAVLHGARNVSAWQSRP